MIKKVLNRLKELGLKYWIIPAMFVGVISLALWMDGVDSDSVMAIVLILVWVVALRVPRLVLKPQPHRPD
jgi:hypothetical protein